MRRMVLAAVLLAFVPMSASLAGVPAPRVPVRSLAALHTPLPYQIGRAHV